VNLSTGTISTAAGNGTAGYAGDGGPATAATLNFPTGVAVDSSGNVAIADTNNNRVRKIAAKNGVISTQAGTGAGGFSGDGGPAVTAEIKQPLGVGAGPDGSAYVADSGNGIVRRIDTTGTITTVAGTPSVAGYGGDGGPATAARLNFPTAVAVDGFGN